jgi:hypothetical protein
MKPLHFVLKTDAAREKLIAVLNTLRVPNKPPFEVVVRPALKWKTLQQLRTVHMWFTDIAGHTGETEKEVKERLKDEYGVHEGSYTHALTAEDCKALGIQLQDGMLLTMELPILKSLADYNVAEMAEFMLKVQQYAAEHGIEMRIPVGDSVWDSTW